MIKKVPNYIKKKIKQLDKTLNKANQLRVELEDWLNKKDIDYCTCRDGYIFSDDVGCGHGISLEALEQYIEDCNNEEII